VTLRSSEMEFH